MLASGLKSNLGYEDAYRVDEQTLGLFGIVSCEDCSADKFQWKPGGFK